MTWTAERIAAGVIVMMLAVFAVAWIAVARERRRQGRMRCAWCSYLAERRDECECGERCSSPRCDPKQERAAQRETRRAA